MDGMEVIGSLAGMRGVLLQASRGLSTVTKRTAFFLERTILKHMQNQDLAWEALKPNYKARKITEGYSEKIWIRTSTSMQTLSTTPAGNDAFFVGWVRGATSKDGEPMVKFLKRIEYGSLDGTQKPRPLVAPSVKEARQFFEAELERTFRDAGFSK